LLEDWFHRIQDRLIQPYYAANLAGGGSAATGRALDLLTGLVPGGTYGIRTGEPERDADASGTLAFTAQAP
jgi:hypothetical protein